MRKEHERCFTVCTWRRQPQRRRPDRRWRGTEAAKRGPGEKRSSGGPSDQRGSTQQQPELIHSQPASQPAHSVLFSMLHRPSVTVTASPGLALPPPPVAPLLPPWPAFLAQGFCCCCSCCPCNPLGSWLPTMPRNSAAAGQRQSRREEGSGAGRRRRRRWQQQQEGVTAGRRALTRYAGLQVQVRGYVLLGALEDGRLCGQVGLRLDQLGQVVDR